MPTTKKEILSRLNNNFAKLTPGGIREFDYQVNSIPGIIKLTLGEPDFNVPAAMKQAAIDSINANDSHYAPGNGTLVLRQAIAHFMQDRYQLDYDPENEIAVTVGATEGIFASLSTIINPGDEIIIPTPTFPSTWLSQRFLVESRLKLIQAAMVLSSHQKDSKAY